MRAVIPGFANHRITVDGIEIACDVGGTGPALLLLHGYPQHRGMWRHVAPTLAENYTVVVPDLRGYGQSATPPSDPTHLAYSKRTMAAEQVAVMAAFGHRRFAVCGHDRGGRVAHRMCLDHPDAVTAAAVIDIVPTHLLFTRTDAAFAGAYYHWFFLSQPPDLPERLIGGSADYFVTTTLERWSGHGFTFAPEDVAGYVAAFTPEVIHASCEDYRAAATIDLEHDAADIERRITCPLLVLWGVHGAMHRLYDVPATWRDRASHVAAVPVDCGHFVPEEAPDATIAAVSDFLGRVTPW